MGVKYVLIFTNYKLETNAMDVCLSSHETAHGILVAIEALNKACRLVGLRMVVAISSFGRGSDGRANRLKYSFWLRMLCKLFSRTRS